MLPGLSIVRTPARKMTALPGLSRNIYKCSSRGKPRKFRVPLPRQGAGELSPFASVPAGTAASFLQSWELAQEQGIDTSSTNKSTE